MLIVVNGYEKRKGTATVRKRRLPVLQVIWLVLGMALLRNRSIADVVSKLDLALPGPRGPTVAPSAVANSRKRLGEEPMEWLFHRCAREWAHESASNHRWHGLSLYGVDGTTLRVPDSIENRTEFGGQGAGASRRSTFRDGRSTKREERFFQRKADCTVRLVQ